MQWRGKYDVFKQFLPDLYVGRGMEARMNKEIITAIEEYSDKGMDGFLITTDQQQIKLAIDNCQSCCENWGYFMSEDDFSEFVGAELLDIKIVDQLLVTRDFYPDDVGDGGVMFVNIETSNGTLQFVAYNDHNGYYGHDACVVSRQLNHEATL